MTLTAYQGNRRDADPAQPTSVYLYYDARGLLIYVGITARGMLRQLQHNGGAEWWKFANRQDIEHYPDRPTAAARELDLIREHLPPFNIVGNPAHPERRAAYLTLFGAGPGMYRCGHCFACSEGWDECHAATAEDDGGRCEHCGRPSSECLHFAGREEGRYEGYGDGFKAGDDRGRAATLNFWVPWIGPTICLDWHVDRLGFNPLPSRVDDIRAKDAEIATRGLGVLVDEAAERAKDPWVGVSA